MPRLQIVRLPNDHTSGTATNKPTPTAALGDNDAALGRVIEALSESKFWSSTAIFIVEDDAQNGPDHVDAHRTIAFVISPYVKRGSVDSTLYSTSSMLRTMELILGLPPMSYYDAAATPLYNAFQGTPNLAPYRRLIPAVSLDERNTSTAFGAAISGSLNFSDADLTPEEPLNDVIWRSVKGPHSPMPPPRRSVFVPR